MNRPAQRLDATLPALDLLATAVLLVGPNARVVQANLAAQDLLGQALGGLLGQSLDQLFPESPALASLVPEARAGTLTRQRLHLHLPRGQHEPLVLDAVFQVIDGRADLLASLELREIDHQLRIDREERLLDLGRANKELIRNLAHEIRNPLGGIRGAAQLLEPELIDPGLTEYTQVIIKEADRLQLLVDRLLAPHRRAQVRALINIHEVLEHVRSLVLAEYPVGLEIRRDYDVSLPEFMADREQLVQVVLNLVQNAAQMMAGQGLMVLRTRVVRRVTLARQLHRLALDLHVIDHGPGIPESLRDQIFYPLVSARPGGSGMGLTLAQTFIHQHGGTIACESRPGLTDFQVLLPLGDGAATS